MPDYQFIAHKEQGLAYWTIGAGPVLVLLHGFCEDSRIWWPFVEPLVQDYQIVGIDLCGFGKSDTPIDPSMGTLATAVEAVLRALSVEKAALLGHSMGGYVALAFAEMYPDKLTGLGLFHSHPYADSAPKRANRQKVIEFVKIHGVEPFVAQLSKKLFGYLFSDEHPESIASFVQRAAQYTPDAVIAAAAAMKNRPDRSQVLEDLSCPVLFIVGKEDRAIPKRDSLQQLVLPDFGLIHLLPEVGHMAMYEAPEQCLAAIREWLQQLKA